MNSGGINNDNKPNAGEKIKSSSRWKLSLCILNGSRLTRFQTTTLHSVMIEISQQTLILVLSSIPVPRLSIELIYGVNGQ